jgi:tRNA(fMet)-specific endonuclease VapC
LAELNYDAARHPKGPAIRKEIDEFVSRLVVIPWDEIAADHYGEIRATMEKDGTPIGAMDMMIAAHARSQGATLVSNNIRHFDKVPGLHIANWV